MGLIVILAAVVIVAWTWVLAIRDVTVCHKCGGRMKRSYDGERDAEVWTCKNCGNQFTITG